MGRGKNKAKNKAKRAKQTPKLGSRTQPRAPVELLPSMTFVALRELAGPSGVHRTLISADDSLGDPILSFTELPGEPDFAARAITELLARRPSIRQIFVDSEDLIAACPGSVEVIFDPSVAIELDMVAGELEHIEHEQALAEIEQGPIAIGVDIEHAAALFEAARRAHAGRFWSVLRFDDELELELDGVKWVAVAARHMAGMHELTVYPSFRDYTADLWATSAPSKELVGLVWMAEEDLSPSERRELEQHGWPAALGSSSHRLYPHIFHHTHSEHLPPRVSDVLVMLALLELLVDLDQRLDELGPGKRHPVELRREVAGRPASLRVPHPGSAWLRRRPLDSFEVALTRWCADRHVAEDEHERALQLELVEAFELFIERAGECTPATVTAFLLEHVVTELPVAPRDLERVPALLTEWISYLGQGPVDELRRATVGASALLRQQGSDPAHFSVSKQIHLARKAAGISSSDALACWAFERGWQAARESG